MSKIEWTEKTWNPIAGCTVKSDGCQNCYALNMANRLQAMGLDKYKGLVRRSGKKAVWTGKINFDEKALLEPLKRKKPTRYFVNSMSDLFHENVPDEWIDRIFAVMALCPQHTFQVLTKRPERMREYFNEGIPLNHGFTDRWYPIEEAAKRIHRITALATCPDIVRLPLPNVWLGVSIEDQKTANERIPLLLDTPAAVRWVSAEPLLGPVDFSTEYLAVKCGGEYPFPNMPDDHRTKLVDLLDWVVVGGESGTGARPMHPEWVRDIQRQCEIANVPFLFKQWGEWAPYDRGSIDQNKLEKYGSTDTPLQKFGKKAAGRLLNGKTYDEYPDTGSASQ
ncbi:DUF5131 family protein [Terasakiella pusilla]|uniref:DUF5131 family protein n=1 Tax=Terasakiella pusilla TaxID=64973 RepID=UPI003AA90B10